MIHAVVGTRPEVIKMAPVITALRRRGLETRVIATGQHCGWSMMGSFLATFGIEVDHTLELGQRSLLGSLVAIISGLGELFARTKPDLVLAVGDTTTVLAAALCARKSGAAFGHVESGLRAFCRELPEEEHRICADAIADLLFAPTRIAVENLGRERVSGKVILTGNPVLDALRSSPPQVPKDEDRHGILMTLHRQETVDDPVRLGQVLAAVAHLSARHEIVWPLHPRTAAKIKEAGLVVPPRVQMTEPLGYREFLARLASARLVVSDSGGVQEESAILGTPCIMVRNSTERPETLAEGIGLLAGTTTAGIVAAIEHVLTNWRRFARPVPHLYGDGRAGEKIADACAEWILRGGCANAAQGQGLCDGSPLRFLWDSA